MQMLLGALVAAFVMGSLPGRSQTAPAPGLSDGQAQAGFTADPAASTSVPAAVKRDRPGSSGAISPHIPIGPAIARQKVSGFRSPPDRIDQIYPVWA